MEQLIKSISYDQEEIIKWIIDLHLKGENIEVDPTYSKGNFYKNIPAPKYKFDIIPQTKGVEKASAEKLPLKDESVNSVMYDPPFLATSGKSLKIDNSSNKINKRFGVYPNEKALHQFYVNSMAEFHRILKPNGILIFKCQDKVSSGKQYFSHNFIMNEAAKIGFYCKDLFILLAKQRMVADWQLKNQKNARKFHSYFIVLEKNNKKIEYI